MSQEKYDFFREKARFIFEDDVPNFIRSQIIEKMTDDEEFSEKIDKMIKDKINHFLNHDIYISQYYTGYKNMIEREQKSIEYLSDEEAAWKVFDHIASKYRINSYARKVSPSKVECHTEDKYTTLNVAYKTGNDRFLYVIMEYYNESQNEFSTQDYITDEPVIGYIVETSKGDEIQSYFINDIEDTDFRGFYFNANEKEREILWDCGFSDNEDFKNNIHRYLGIAT